MNEELKKWHAPCGIWCKTCPGLKVYNCKGCREEKGKVYKFPTCKTYACVTNKGHEFCHECEDFPCEMLMPIVNFEIFSPNNSKVYNLIMIKKLGLEAWDKIVDEQMKLYYKGKKEKYGGDKLVFDKSKDMYKKK